MLPPADLTGTRPLRGVEPIRAVASASDPQREVFNRLTQIALGKMLQAEVMSKLGDGTHLMKIDNAAFKAVLPGEAQVGEFITLKFVTNEPRPTFLLMPRAGADTTSLSTTAKLISNILHASVQDVETVAIAGKIPILPSRIADADAMVGALRNALSMSGVFYESHLRQWVDGTRSLSQIQQEAQTRPNMQSIPTLASPMRPDTSQAAQLLTVVAEWDGTSVAPQPSGASFLPSTERLSNESMQLVNVQLQTLEQGKIAWHGELWPGQPLEWEVNEDKLQEQDEERDASLWTSTVRFALPTLGVVCAHICLRDNRVQMQLRAATDETAVLLQQRSAELAGALDAAGSPLEAFMVKQDEQA